MFSGSGGDLTVSTSHDGCFGGSSDGYSNEECGDENLRY